MSRTTTYWYSLTNSSSGNTRFFGPKNELPKVLSVKEQEKLKEKEDKLKEKSDKKNDKKKEEIASNPFLKNVDTSKPSESSLEDVTVGNRKLAYTYSLDKQYDYKTSETTSAGAALKEYNENYGTVSNTHENDFRNSYTKWVRSYANSLYGYTPTSHWAKFKKLDSDKHPEFNMFDNATKAMKIILEKMRFNRPIGELEKDLGPILSYFEGISNKYTKDDKQEKRLRGAALYNMARIYQFLDLHDKVIEIGNTIIASEHEEKDGKKFVEESTELKRVLDFHKMKSRHIVPRNAADEKEDVGEKAKMEEEGN
ncbi:MAG: hypothetical protein IPN89_08640 [Saprospiraceae bacterium]|nr:hypothetical protein [Saprospiraceae bacterium]